MYADTEFVSRHIFHRTALAAEERVARKLGKPYYHTLRMFGRTEIRKNSRGYRSDGQEC